MYTPKTLKALGSVRSGAIGQVTWGRSREAHSGPHSGWFWDREQAGGGAIVDLGCHCIEIIRNFIGKSIRPVEVTCWARSIRTIRGPWTCLQDVTQVTVAPRLDAGDACA